MELRVLRYFLTVVSERNISKAAEKMHISQPTISRQLKSLEDELGVKLFIRGSRSIDLTSAGEYFANKARQIVTLTDKTVVNIAQTNKEISGSILIGAAEAPMIETIARATHQLGINSPKVQVNIFSSDANDVNERLKAGVFDFGVVTEPMIKSEFNFINLPGTTSWGILIKKGCPLSTKHIITAKDLENQRLIVPQQRGNDGFFASWIGSSQKKFNVVATYNLLYNASLFAAAGVGLVLCLNGIVNTMNSDLTFIPLAPQLTTRARLVWSKDAPLSVAAQAFLNEVKKIIPADH